MTSRRLEPFTHWLEIYIKIVQRSSGVRRFVSAFRNHYQIIFPILSPFLSFHAISLVNLTKAFAFRILPKYSKIWVTLLLKIYAKWHTTLLSVPFNIQPNVSRSTWLLLSPYWKLRADRSDPKLLLLFLWQTELEIISTWEESYFMSSNF